MVEEVKVALLQYENTLLMLIKKYYHQNIKVLIMHDGPFKHDIKLLYLTNI